MITFVHIIYWALMEVCKLYQKKTVTKEQGIDKNYFENSKVKYNNARHHAEIGIQFDPPVYLQRYSAVQDVLLNKNWRDKIIEVVDFGCAELKLFKYLKNLTNIQKILLVDIDKELLTDNTFRVQPLHVDYLSRRSKSLQVEVLQGSVDIPDSRLLSVDAVICIELIEHLYPDTLDAFPYNIFHFIQPRIAIITTPNADFNELFPNFCGLRHDDHKFEWTRQQFEDWAHNIILQYPMYSVYFVGIGPGPVGKEHLGCCSQMAIFVRKTNYENDSKIKDCVDNECLSFGICKYQSYNSLIDNKYNIVCEVDFPFDFDTRTDEEIILHESEHRLHRLSSSVTYSNYESEEVRIPFYELTSNRGGEYISADELRLILQNAGWIIKDFLINDILTPCVIYKISPSSDSSDHSQSVNFNFSTEVNWDSESQWDIESTENWDESMAGNATKSNKNDHNNTQINGTSINDPSVSGISQTDEKVELLFDSGYQISTSSIELSPEISKDWLSDEKREEELQITETEPIRCTKSEKQCKAEESSPSSMKSEGNILNSIKKKCKVEESDVNRIVNARVPPPAPAAEVENVEIVENGDLANNNRDLEGNNYQAAENHIVEVDNANPQAENLDEDNENHIVLDQNDLQPNPHFQEDDDSPENLEDASREVLFDPNSELHLSEESLIVQGRPIISFNEYNLPIIPRFVPPRNSSSDDNFRSPLGFPVWLLHMLNVNREDIEETDEENAHFYSQGDGVGVHPSTSEVSEDSTSSTSSTETLMTNPNTTAVSSSADTSATESVFQDALDYVPPTDTNEQENQQQVNVQSVNTDNSQPSSSKPGQ